MLMQRVATDEGRHVISKQYIDTNTSESNWVNKDGRLYNYLTLVKMFQIDIIPYHPILIYFCRLSNLGIGPVKKSKNNQKRHLRFVDVTGW